MAARAAAAPPSERATSGAATRLAEEMRREAELQARAPRTAGAGSSTVRVETNGNASEDLARASAAAHGFLERLGEATGELSGLLARVQDSAGALGRELETMAGSVPPLPGPAAAHEAAPAPGTPPARTPPEACAGGPEPPSPPATAEDAARARLLAFNLASNGASREETARYLTENFPLTERTDLLNEVFARAASDATVTAPSEVIKDL